MRSRLTPSLCILLAVCSAACGEDTPAASGPSPFAIPSPGPGARAPGAAGAAAAPPGAPSAPVYRDSDFVESDRNRDPFRSFVNELKAKMPVVAQRAVIMPNTPIDSMKLIAIISGISQPRAMLVDEKGVGYVTARGDFVGKADVVQGGGSESLPIALNWRVDRIRENEVVLAREDPSAPNRPPLTKVIPLHEQGEGTGDQG